MCIAILKIADAFFGSPHTEPANGSFPLIQDSTPEVALLLSRSVTTSTGSQKISRPGGLTCEPTSQMGLFSLSSTIEQRSS